MTTVATTSNINIMLLLQTSTNVLRVTTVVTTNNINIMLLLQTSTNVLRVTTVATTSNINIMLLLQTSTNVLRVTTVVTTTRNVKTMTAAFRASATLVTMETVFPALVRGVIHVLSLIIGIHLRQ